MKFTIVVEAFLLYITMHLVFLICAVLEKKIFENGPILGTFCPAPKAPGGKSPEIHNLCAPCPKDASYQI
jgi:hypothetical protein